MKRLLMVCWIASVLLSGCGGGGPPPPPPVITVAIAPGTPQTIDQGQTQNFAATVSNDAAHQGVTWSLSGASCSGAACGTFTNVTATSVTYNAPASLSSDLSVTVTAASVSNGTKSATVTATILALTVSISPTTATLSSAREITATVSNDAADQGVTWTLAQGGVPCSPACGAISPPSTTSDIPTTYTPPADLPAPSTIVLTATSVADSSKSASATLTVMPEAKGGSNYAWYQLDPPCGRGPYGIIVNYDTATATIDAQLQAMYDNGQRRLRIPIFFGRGLSDGTLVDSTGGGPCPAFPGQSAKPLSCH